MKFFDENAEQSEAEVTSVAKEEAPEELEDDALAKVAGGLVQLVNPSSSRL